MRGNPSMQPAAGRRLGVMEAVGLGWRLMLSDFWRLWLAALVAHLVIMAGSSVAGGVGGIVLSPPLLAGLYLVIGRRMDGGAAEVGDLFVGFKERFAQSVVAMLLPNLAVFVPGIVVGPFILLAVLSGAGLGAAIEREEAVGLLFAGGMCLGYALFAVLVLAAVVFAWFFVFALPGVWDRPQSGWEAAKASMRLVRDSFWSIAGLHLLFWAIGVAAVTASVVTCCIGGFFFFPAMMVWQQATVLYLYRSWTGLRGSLPPAAPTPQIGGGLAGASPP